MARYTTLDTVWDLIEANLVSALKGIKEVDGYNFTVKDVVTWGTEGFPFTGAWPAAGLVFGDEDRDEVFAAWGRRCKRDFGIEMWVQAPLQKRGEPTLSRVYQQVLADLEKALVSGSAYTRGGYAEDTRLLSAQPWIDDGKTLVGCGLRGTIVYRHKVGDLYTVM